MLAVWRFCHHMGLLHPNWEHRLAALSGPSAQFPWKFMETGVFLSSAKHSPSLQATHSTRVSCNKTMNHWQRAQELKFPQGQNKNMSLYLPSHFSCKQEAISVTKGHSP